MTSADRVRILAEARDTLERADAAITIKTKPYVPPGPPPPKSDDWPRDADTPCATVPLVSCAAMDAWRADAIVREAAKAAANARRRQEELEMTREAREQQQQVRQQSTIDDVLELAARLADLFETVSELIDTNAEHRDRISALEAQIDDLRAEHQHERELAYWTQHFARTEPQEQSSGRTDKAARVIDLPNPIRRIS